MHLPEDQYIIQLNRYLRTGNFVSFERLVDRLSDEGIEIDLTHLSDVEEKVSNLFITYLFANFNLDGVFKVFKFANDFQLFTATSKKLDFPISSQTRELMTATLQNLFGPLSEGFFDYIVYFLPAYLAEILANGNLMMMNDPNVPLPRRIEVAYFYVNSYMNYGLRTRNVGSFNEYFEAYEENKESFDNDYYVFDIDKMSRIRERSPFEEIRYFIDTMHFYEKHLVYAPLLERIKKKFKRNEYGYEYPIVSMVITGGVGPEGKGFVYLTPKGEVIEVCSDVRQNKAYIIEYKKYLKSVFLEKLRNRMQPWKISEELKNEIIIYFDKNIHTKMVGYDEIETLLKERIFTYLKDNVNAYINPEFKAFLRKSLLEILIPVQMEDQFKVRMDLIKNNKLTETEVVKLVSLGDVSHFDVLNQRLFFLLLVDNVVRVLKTQNRL
ncbi:MAG: hypothetical protein HWN65_16225 [Candidatus Helarchaeota archaeon]|nr:hypothetical protein [Candidatus Helarchaeota archaeon]